MEIEQLVDCLREHSNLPNYSISYYLKIYGQLDECAQNEVFKYLFNSWGSKVSVYEDSVLIKKLFQISDKYDQISKQEFALQLICMLHSASLKSIIARCYSFIDKNSIFDIICNFLILGTSFFTGSLENTDLDINLEKGEYIKRLWDMLGNTFGLFDDSIYYIFEYNDSLHQIIGIVFKYIEYESFDMFLSSDQHSKYCYTEENNYSQKYRNYTNTVCVCENWRVFLIQLLITTNKTQKLKDLGIFYETMKNLYKYPVSHFLSQKTIMEIAKFWIYLVRNNSFHYTNKLQNEKKPLDQMHWTSVASCAPFIGVNIIIPLIRSLLNYKELGYEEHSSEYWSIIRAPILIFFLLCRSIISNNDIISNSDLDFAVHTLRRILDTYSNTLIINIQVFIGILCCIWPLESLCNYQELPRKEQDKFEILSIIASKILDKLQNNQALEYLLRYMSSELTCNGISNSLTIAGEEYKLRYAKLFSNSLYTGCQKYSPSLCNLWLNLKNKQINYFDSNTCKYSDINSKNLNSPCEPYVSEDFTAKLSNSKRGVGIVNMGNTCYIASLLQALHLTKLFISTLSYSSTWILKNNPNSLQTLICIPSLGSTTDNTKNILSSGYLKVTPYLHKNDVAYELLQVLCYLTLSERVSINISQMKFLIPLETCMEQHDVTEYAHLLWSQLACSNNISEEAKQREMSEVSYTDVPQFTFGGEMISMLVCNNCTYESYHKEKFMDIGLAVNNRSSNWSKVIKIQDLDLTPKEFQECDTFSNSSRECNSKSKDYCIDIIQEIITSSSSTSTIINDQDLSDGSTQDSNTTVATATMTSVLSNLEDKHDGIYSRVDSGSEFNYTSFSGNTIVMNSPTTDKNTYCWNRDGKNYVDNIHSALYQPENNINILKSDIEKTYPTSNPIFSDKYNCQEQSDSKYTPTNVLQLLSSYFSPELLPDYRCNSCGILGNTHRRYLIHKPPHILIIVLNRFEFLPNQNVQRKISRFVKLDKKLTMYSTCVYHADDSIDGWIFEDHNQEDYKERRNSDCETETTTSNDIKIYELYSVIVHQGHTPHSGHYFTIGKNYSNSESSMWTEYNDLQISSFHESQLDSHTNGYSTAYVLFYQLTENNDSFCIPREIYFDILNDNMTYLINNEESQIPQKLLFAPNKDLFKFFDKGIY
ncbi:ubiquitin carboxyl-terminal hydrolase family protein [Cryptosporidium muris RN66]|uniref:Ubiquitin carboxyl-terminal hydrolase family protein n=1 Tax=Cryptosporidium muris (strain RN66) TaxID=441375 RepID=B6AC54_CRYMR|nr:ubiquitin carboxyl-terminal hydrolase family protein [Cryptosporidium muris RN66]EEA05407.1 ubiquitin carboxyl-terminal hydrolase family protein [Cryptosporidium muris RN66]|eukprot:XP_002139756.1 ubiquitin carboxyl-terminal hydrolase family protein [Cryptosporidium muris RN66]